MESTIVAFWFEVVLGVGLLLLIPAAIVSGKLVRVLETRHPQIWQDLGEPKLNPLKIDKGGKAGNLRGFIKSRANEALGDQELNRYAMMARALTFSIGLLIAIGMLLVLVMALGATTS